VGGESGAWGVVNIAVSSQCVARNSLLLVCDIRSFVGSKFTGYRKLMLASREILCVVWYTKVAYITVSITALLLGPQTRKIHFNIIPPSLPAS
jgi:hypothetical protein